MEIAPSMLACDFAKMGEEIGRVSRGGADYIHLDVMDGSFVPNISFGPAVIRALKGYTDVPFDVHLMIQNPRRYIKHFADAGADIISFHIEAEPDVAGAIDDIIALGVKPALTLKPGTPVEELYPYLDKLFMVLVMSVEPGFGGQSFMPGMLEKVKKVKAEAARRGLSLLVEIDGGINEQTIVASARAGVDIAVAGTSVFQAQNTAQAISRLKEVCAQL